MTKRRVFRAGAAAVTAAGIGIAALLITASPASAAMECYENQGVFGTPGFYTDVTIKLCAASEEVGDEEMVQGRAYVSYSRPAPLIDGFDKFELALRLEHHQANIDVHACELKDSLNEGMSGTAYCDTTWASKAGGGWTADGVVTYNINNDGMGDDSWVLHGSPSI